MKLSVEQSNELVEKIRYNKIQFDENKHPSMLLRIMSDPEKSRMSAFCAEVGIGESKFYEWLKKSPLFLEVYGLGKILSRENWEKEGLDIKDQITMPGVISNKFEHWKMVGWSRFGIGKTCKLKLDLNPEDKPTAHYAQLIRQANNGEFTASEIKQLMEALNLGLKTQQNIEMQEEIDKLKADLIKMNENMHGNNSFSAQSITKTNQDTVAN